MVVLVQLEKKIWESEFFSEDIWSFDVNEAYTGQFPNGLITSKVNSNNYEGINKLNGFGFDFCEGELVFIYELCDIEPDVKFVIPAEKESLVELLSISDKLYTFSRFREPWFQVEDKDKFYNEWITNSLLFDFEDIFLIYKSNDIIQGFITVKLVGEQAVIALLGVAKEFSGQGIASKLISASKKVSKDLGMKNIAVSTQTSNLNAIRLYEKNNFKINNLNYWFYKKEK